MSFEERLNAVILAQQYEIESLKGYKDMVDRAKELPQYIWFCDNCNDWKQEKLDIHTPDGIVNGPSFSDYRHLYEHPFKYYEPGIICTECNGKLCGDCSTVCITCEIKRDGEYATRLCSKCAKDGTIINNMCEACIECYGTNDLYNVIRDIPGDQIPPKYKYLFTSNSE